MAGVIEEQIKETLTCKICYQVLNNPKALPCMHTYCCGCLGELTKESDDNTVKCPECRQVHTVPEKGVDGFNVNFTTKTLVEIFNAAETDDTPKCIMCEVNKNGDIKAVIKCLECNKYLCKTCMDNHNGFIQGHTTVDLTGDKSHDMQRALKTVKDRTIHCPKHNIPLQIYCKVDKCIVCATCYAISHLGHESVDIQEAAEESVQQIQKLLKCGDDLVEHYETAIGETHKTKHKMESEVNDAICELTNDMNAAIQHIRNIYTQNIDRFAEKRDACTKQTIAHLGHLELQKTLVESTMNQLSTVKDYGHHVELANMAQEIDSKLKQWTHVPNVSFDVNMKVAFRKGKLYKDRIVFACINEDSENVPSKDTEKRRNQSKLHEEGSQFGLKIVKTLEDGVDAVTLQNSPRLTRQRSALNSGSRLKAASTHEKRATEAQCVQCADGTLGVWQMDCSHWYCYSCEGYLVKDPSVRDCVMCTKRPPKDASVDNVKEEDPCIICLERMVKPKTLEKCGHSFCKDCIDGWMMRSRPQCPVCGVSYGKRKGDQPKGGTMTSRKTYTSLPGYDGCGHIEIIYSIPNGTQESIHPSPGKNYRGIHWTAYLPDNKEGNEIAALLKKAFDKRLIFTIGQSRTRGTDDVVTWNDIQHKTKIYGEPSHFGYPDPDYLARVRAELADKGIE